MQKFRSKIDWWILAFFIAMSGLLLQLVLTMYAKGTSAEATLELQRRELLAQLRQAYLQYWSASERRALADEYLVDRHAARIGAVAAYRRGPAARTTTQEAHGGYAVYPVHLNPQVKTVVEARLGGTRAIHLIPPVDYVQMVALMQAAHLILTDSGGIQEEAPALGKPVLVMRDVTERPEAVATGVAQLVGTDVATMSPPRAACSTIPRTTPPARAKYSPTATARQRRRSPPASPAS